MFDKYEQRRGGYTFNTSLNSPCLGLGGCDNHRARAEQQEAIERSFPAKISEIERQISEIKTGAQQKEFALLVQKQEALQQTLIKLTSQAEKLKLTADAWENTPKEQANAEGLGGLGWFGKRLWNKAFSCEHYEDRLNESIERTRPLEQKLSSVSTTLDNLKAQFSVENLQKQKNAIQVLEKSISEKKELIKSYEKRISDARISFQANKDAERLALDREAQEAAAKKAAENAAASNSKTSKTIILVGIALVGGYFLLKKNKS